MLFQLNTFKSVLVHYHLQEIVRHVVKWFEQRWLTEAISAAAATFLLSSMTGINRSVVYLPQTPQRKVL